jgi:hypothetical protein
VTGPAFAADPLRDQAKGLFEPIPETPPALPGEPSTPEKVALGKMLYFEPRISESHEYSCSTCHNIGMGGADGRSSSVGHQWQLSGRKTLSVLNAVFNKSQYFDGRASDLKDQVVRSVMAFPAALLRTRGGPTIFNPAEMNITKQHAVEQLKAIQFIVLLDDNGGIGCQYKRLRSIANHSVTNEIAINRCSLIELPVSTPKRGVVATEGGRIGRTTSGWRPVSDLRNSVKLQAELGLAHDRHSLF